MRTCVTDQSRALIERLRKPKNGEITDMLKAAADEIERLIKKGEAVSTMAESYGQALEAMGREIERLTARIADLEGQLLPTLGERPMRGGGI